MSPLAAALLSALLLGLGLSVSRWGVDAGSVWLGCDSFDKVMLDRDLSSAVWRCPGPSWPESILKLPSIDTTYPPQPAKQVCMDTPLTYNDTIPNSGAFRPVGAASGEFLYCPPQRWLNNLQRGVPVFLYHPCAPVLQRVRLSVLARACLPDYVLTPQPSLSTHRPFALVSWGRTLELSSLTVPGEVCDWLESTAASHGHYGDAGRRGQKKYTLLLTRPAPALQRESLRRCCEESLSLTQDGGVVEERVDDAGLGRRRGKRETPGTEVERDRRRREGKRRRSVALRPPSEKERDNRTNGTTAPNSHSPIRAQKPKHQEVNPEPKTSPERGPDRQVATLSLGGDDDNTGGVKERGGEERDTMDSDGQEGDAGPADPQTETLLEVRKRHKTDDRGNTHRHRTNPSPGSKPRTRELPQHAVPGRESGSTEAKGGPPLGGAPPVLSSRVHTPRTEEAAWAAAALGFLLVLLALSVLHTRLYRHWHTAPSLYWHHHGQDYDSVADIIRRLKRKRKRKRKVSQSRRQDCVLLPSSSSTDEEVFDL